MPSPESQLGTAGHTLLERTLRSYFKDNVSGGNAFDHIGETIMNEDKSTFVVDENMASAVQVAVDYILGIYDLDNKCEVFIEQDLDLGWIRKLFGIKKEMYGTGDVVIVQPFGDMWVIDYKHGKGISVEAIGNTQTRFYGAGALGPDNPHFVERVHLVIVQPRAEHEDGPIREEVITVAEQYRWIMEELGPKAKATQDPDASCTCGEWCASTFCPGKADCPALRGKMEVLKTMAFAEGGVPRATKSLSDQQIADWMDISSMLSTYDGAVKKEAMDRSRGGRVIPGYKVVQGKATRSWINDQMVIAKMAQLGYFEADLFTSKLKSPKGMGDLLKENGLSKKEYKNIVDPFVQETHGQALAPESSKKKAIATAKQIFKDYLEE
jgi:hypothetical protein